MARRNTELAPELFVATTSGASEWIEQHALDDFPSGVVTPGVLVRSDHPILSVHPSWFRPADEVATEARRQRLAGSA